MVECPENVYDFGRIYNFKQDAVEHAFRIHNKGDEDLEILKVRACCGAKARVTSKTIQPGSNAFLNVSISIRSRKGKIKKSLYIESNDPRQRLVQFRVEGEAVPQIDVEPPSVRLDSLRPDENRELIVKIASFYRDPLDITNVVCTLPFLQTEIVPVEEKSIHLLRVRTEPPLETGTKTGLITLQTSHPQTQEIEIDVICSVSKKVEVIAAGPPSEPVAIDYFYEPGCPTCAKVENRVLPKLENYGPGVCKLNRYDLSKKKNIATLLQYQEQLDMDSNASVSVVIDRQRVLSGFEEVAAGLEIEVDAALERRRDPEWTASLPIDQTDSQTEEGELAQGRIEKFALATLLLDGLADGLNPCAIATLVFFASMLGLAGTRRRISRGKQLLLMGLPFCLATFATYTALGFGLLQTLRLLDGFERASAAFNWAMIALLGSFAVVSFRDALAYRKTADPDSVILQLPDSLKKRVHRVVRERARRGSLVLAGLSIGFLVTLIESVCTGQMYVPALVLMIETGRGTLRTWGYLLAYNAMFVVPLLTILAVVYMGVSTEKLADLSRRNVPASKALLGTLFLAMAVLLAIM